MRHQTKKHTLGKAQDQRKALLRSLATELFVHGEITTTMARAKALKPYAEKIITLAKKGDLHSIRQAARYIYNKETGKYIDLTSGEVFETPQADKKLASQTVLRKLFVVIGKQYSDIVFVGYYTFPYAVYFAHNCAAHNSQTHSTA